MHVYPMSRTWDTFGPGSGTMDEWCWLPWRSLLNFRGILKVGKCTTVTMKKMLVSYVKQVNIEGQLKILWVIYSTWTCVLSITWRAIQHAFEHYNKSLKGSAFLKVSYTLFLHSSFTGWHCDCSKVNEHKWLNSSIHNVNEHENCSVLTRTCSCDFKCRSVFGGLIYMLYAARQC